MKKHDNVVTGWNKNEKIVFLQTFSKEQKEEMFEAYDKVKEEFPYWAMQSLERFSEMMDKAITLGENETIK